MFPTKGIDQVTELESQRQDTTATGTNVRTYEPATLRARGGARPGLSKYIDDTASTTIAGSVIQHLNFIVDPTTDALLSDDASHAGDPDYILDPTGPPRNPGGRYVRKKGSGRQPNTKIPKTLVTVTANDQTKTAGATFTWTGTEFTSSGLQLGDTISFVKMWSKGAPAAAVTSDSPFPIYAAGATGATISGASVATKYKLKYVPGIMTISPFSLVQGDHSAFPTAFPLPFPGAVTAGHLLLLLAYTTDGAQTGGAISLAPVDTQGNIWTQAGTYARIVSPTLGLGEEVAASIWYAIAGVSGANAVNPTETGSGLITGQWGIFEFSSGATFDSFSKTTGTPTGAPLSTGTVSVSTPGELVVAIFGSIFGGFTATPQTGFPFDGPYGDQVSLVSIAMGATGTGGGAADRYAAIGASFKPL